MVDDVMEANVMTADLAVAAYALLLHRLRCNGLAACGAYTALAEDRGASATRVPVLAA